MEEEDSGLVLTGHAWAVYHQKTMSKQTPAGHQALVDSFLRHFEENFDLREGKPLTYDQMHGMGLLKPYAARLPVTMIAELETLAHYGPWKSKQEMIYQLLKASLDSIAADSAFMQDELNSAAESALGEWRKAQGTEVRVAKMGVKAKK